MDITNKLSIVKPKILNKSVLKLILNSIIAVVAVQQLNHQRKVIWQCSLTMYVKHGIAPAKRPATLNCFSLIFMISCALYVLVYLYMVSVTASHGFESCPSQRIERASTWGNGSQTAKPNALTGGTDLTLIKQRKPRHKNERIKYPYNR